MSQPNASHNPHPSGLSRYATLSTQPLYVLVFLTPMLAAYEVGSALFLTDPDTGMVRETIRAHALFSRFFDLFGVGGAMLPGIALVVVLALWHLLTRNSWKIKPAVLGMMLIESAAWTLPLFVMGQAIGLMALARIDIAPSRSFSADATIALGAGLYEELLFRMVAIAAAHFVLVDLIQMKETPGRVAAIALAAVAFALYHDDWSSNFAFLSLAGAFFGAIYVYRGFGVVVATHAIYDLVVLAM